MPNATIQDIWVRKAEEKYINMPRFKLIAGPCAVEDRDTCFTIAEHLTKLSAKYDLELIFKASYKKANRTRLGSFSSIGEERALQVLEDIRKEFAVNTITDVHESTDPEQIGQHVDYLQIPAFLCRQTDLLINSGKFAGKGVNIKKGQFLSPEMMQFAAEKVRFGNPDTEILLTERGTTFGYEYLVTDMTSFPKMAPFGTTIMDCTHSVQIPNQSSGITGGDARMIGTMAKSSIAAGAQGLFIEVHPEPAKASSDAGSILQMDKLEPILSVCVRIFDAVNG